MAIYSPEFDDLFTKRIQEVVAKLDEIRDYVLDYYNPFAEAENVVQKEMTLNIYATIQATGGQLEMLVARMMAYRRGTEKIDPEAQERLREWILNTVETKKNKKL